MFTPFSCIAIIGPGLLGGSVAYAIREAYPECELRIWARREASIQQAQQLQLADVASTDLLTIVRGASLVILATPISAFLPLSEAMLPALSHDCLVTDLGSVKDYVHRTTGQFLSDHGHYFLGSHPMAGAEKQGMEHAHASLLDQATVAICNEQTVPEDMVKRLEQFWTQLGCKPYCMRSKLHDQSVARISHLPHVLAALCARGALSDKVELHDLQRLAASGFRDTTRVSTGSPDMWADILWENDVALRESIRDCIDDLQGLIDLLERQEREKTRAWLLEAKLAREEIYGR